MTTIDTHKWTTNFADVQIGIHRHRTRAFLKDVAKPALAALDADIEHWATTREGAWMFAKADAEALFRVTIQAFCLSIQSLWERQLRNWLSACITPGPKSTLQRRTAQHGTMDKLSALLVELRGIPLTAFSTWDEPDLLQRVANACRHGDGSSAVELFRSNPELWPNWSSAPLALPTDDPPMGPPPPPSFEQAVLPRELLDRFVEAIVGFWEDVDYVRLNSIERPDDNIWAEMNRLRGRRMSRMSHAG
jgi:hypothetical protein